MVAMDLAREEVIHIAEAKIQHLNFEAVRSQIQVGSFNSCRRKTWNSSFQFVCRFNSLIRSLNLKKTKTPLGFYLFTKNVYIFPWVLKSFYYKFYKKNFIIFITMYLFFYFFFKKKLYSIILDDRQKTVNSYCTNGTEWHFPSNNKKLLLRALMAKKMDFLNFSSR